MSTNVPQIQWTGSGLVVPTAAAVLAGVQADLNAAFGGNLNPALNTPQGQLATTFAAVVSGCYAAIAYMVNNVNPYAASDFMQDAIGAIYFLNRIPGTPTAVQCQCVGAQGTVIPVGAQATDTSGNSYQCTEAGVIPNSGTITLSFANVADGPIACPANTLVNIYQAIPGWNTINNSSQGVPGTNVETEAAYGARMEASVAVNATGFLASIYGTLAALPGVTSVYVTENDTNGSVNTGSTSYPLAANSIYCAVVGGLAASIANAIFTKKSPGCAMNGNQSVTVYDTSYPAGSQPSYTIKYEVPNALAITFNVNIKNVATLPANIVQLVQNAILAQFNAGTNLVPAVGIASLIVAANYFAPIIAAFPGMQLLSVTIGTSFSGLGTLASSTTLTITTASSGFLGVGDYVTGTDIPANTYIVSQLTGTLGGVGTYQMSAAATGTVGTPEAIASAIGNNQTYQAGIDQAPTLTAGGITVNLI
jgi:uncharacterized phage protein gp47/JayE